MVVYSPRVRMLFKRNSLSCLETEFWEALLWAWSWQVGWIPAAVFKLLKGKSWRGDSPGDGHTREAEAAAAAGAGGDGEVTIFKPSEEHLLPSTLFNHHHQELVDNYGKKSRRRGEFQLELACVSHMPVQASATSCTAFLQLVLPNQQKFQLCLWHTFCFPSPWRGRTALPSLKEEWSEAQSRCGISQSCSGDWWQSCC